VTFIQYQIYYEILTNQVTRISKALYENLDKINPNIKFESFKQFKITQTFPS